MRRLLIIAFAWLGGATAANAAVATDGAALPDAEPRWRPDASYVQAGTGHSTDSWSMGVRWDWHRQWRFGESLLVSGRWELGIGRLRALANWRNDDDAWYTSVGFLPILRLVNERHPHWYVETGAGPSVLLPVYVSRERTFSTQFNVDTRVATGIVLGHAGRHDLAVCFDHYSNGNIEQPNPGLNQYSVRYTLRL